jgi:hypothetical protein
MRSRKKLFSFVLCMIIAQVGRVVLAQSSDMAAREAGAAGTHPASFSFITNREPIINLDGMWRFHPGDDARWASPTFDDSAWPLLRSDEPWTKQGYSSPSGFAWYRFNVQAPSSSTPLALLLPSILTDYEVFENGKKIGGFGRVPPHGSLRFSQTLLYHLDPVPEGLTSSLRFVSGIMLSLRPTSAAVRATQAHVWDKKQRWKTSFASCRASD